ncbi:NagB transferase-like protein [Venustampulla echinocandica]|uniref:5-formyltetrahydrofolate cyclo-ligase n=1 Tax=Venustampulla echinocandica TaxID=2656787 RepID=A0A370TTK4_9HELO|nr:NagB transferase-like protein [Venustampulla echinocandica]RDL38834.1 NagB transferase-like protein [Venustampulla echinocandica]
MASASALKAAKKELRSVMKQRLLTVSPESIGAQSAAVLQRVTNFKPYQDAKRIGIYLSMPTGEIQTDAIVRDALASGKQVFVPYLHKSQNQSPNTPRSVMDMVKLGSMADYESLKQDSWGIPSIEPKTVHEREHILGNSTTPTEVGQLDMVLMPGVAFDIDPRNGFVRRLGHGKGFYDYFLHKYIQGRGPAVKELSHGPRTGALLYGLALDEQFLQENNEHAVPVGEHDHLLHGLFMGDGKVVGSTINTT